MVFTVDANPEEIVLIPESCPIPVRRSSHLTLNPESPDVTVRVFLKSGNVDGIKTQIAEVTHSPMVNVVERFWMKPRKSKMIATIIDYSKNH